MFFVYPLVTPVFGVFQPCSSRVSAPLVAPCPLHTPDTSGGRRTPTVTAIVMAARRVGASPSAALALQPL